MHQFSYPDNLLNDHAPEAGRGSILEPELEDLITRSGRQAQINLDWLARSMPAYFFITMRSDAEALDALALNLHRAVGQRKLVLNDQEKKLCVATADRPGTVYSSLASVKERAISYAEMTTSNQPLPDGNQRLEVHRFEFDLKTEAEVANAARTGLPRGLGKAVTQAMRNSYPSFDFREFHRLLGLLWLNNPGYVLVSPPERLARSLWLYQQGRSHDGLFLEVEAAASNGSGKSESRILFSVGNPPKTGFLAQIMEVFNRLEVGVRRFYSLVLNTGLHAYLLGSFYVTARDGRLIEKGSPLFGQLKNELYNTQILSPEGRTYQSFVTGRIMAGEEVSLVDALAAFCHTSLAHAVPDSFSRAAVEGTFLAHPDITQALIRLFRARFDPDLTDRESLYQSRLQETRKIIETYNTGHRHLDEIRRQVLKTGLLFIRHCLKTNFFVPEKHALAFRLDPAYLSELGPEFTRDLPPRRPFRVTFFHSRLGTGFHVGFSDIARGGWRTIICRGDDELTTSTNNLFREVYVLAHTQHLKNKDIYEGGSKMTVVLDARQVTPEAEVTQRLYKLQYAFLNAFLDIFVTTDGRARHPRVVDHYGQDEPIEIGPDENMPDAMIEFAARQSVRRGYIMGSGLFSSKKFGINHKEHGVTSRGVVKVSQLAMRQIELDILVDRFSLKFTGGPNGDVAGNAMKLILNHCPQAEIKVVIDGPAVAFDPAGLDRAELARLAGQEDLDRFQPDRLHPDGFILYRHQRRQEDLRQLYRKICRTETGLVEEWLTQDEFQGEVERLLFSVPVDLFLPCGGRPETIDAGNWSRMLGADGRPSARVVVEGANSFITPQARAELQRRGVVLIRDASANKCGVISSSYEIIANLLMSEKEFFRHKEAYVADVLEILERRAADEAGLIFRRHDDHPGRLYTEISEEISEEINAHYAELFDFFQAKPGMMDRPLFRRVILHHLPAFIQKTAPFRGRVATLPAKIKAAILASEIATLMVYKGGWATDLEGSLKAFLKPRFARAEKGQGKA